MHPQLHAYAPRFTSTELMRVLVLLVEVLVTKLFLSPLRAPGWRGECRRARAQSECQYCAVACGQYRRLTETRRGGVSQGSAVGSWSSVMAVALARLPRASRSQNGTGTGAVCPDDRSGIYLLALSTWRCRLKCAVIIWYEVGFSVPSGRTGRSISHGGWPAGIVSGINAIMGLSLPDIGLFLLS